MSVQTQSLTTEQPANTESWRATLNLGLLLGGTALFITLVGLVGAFSESDIIYQIISMGQGLLIVLGVLGGYLTGRRLPNSRQAGIHGLVIGAVIGLVMGIYLVVGSTINLRTIFVNSSPELLKTLSFGLSPMLGAIVLLVGFAIVGALSGLLSQMDEDWRAAILTGLLTILTVGILTDFIKPLLAAGFLKPVSRFFFARSGLSIIGAVILFVVAGGIRLRRDAINTGIAPAKEWINQPERKTIKYGGLGVILVPLLLALPWIVQLYLSDVIDNVGLFILMGLGLNIVVGFAGLLDLGYVAFYAIGAYTMAMLTSPESILGTEWSFWAALPISMIMVGLAGVMLGIPVLRMRGDYLAIVTLGFGEIIRIVVLSEALKPTLGGSEGILAIPKPVLFGLELGDSQYLYYVVLAGCLLALFISTRLSNSRIGRAWVAMREDEDVAEAVGINLVQHKLMAFAIGAMLSGLAGGIFASKLGSIFPHSFNLLISINVLSLIIVGGMASLPGVFVGALIMVGLPELLREFSEFRQLMYGALLVAMMLFKPEGFWPAERVVHEMHEDKELSESIAAGSAAD